MNRRSFLKLLPIALAPLVYRHKAAASLVLPQPQNSDDHGNAEVYQSAMPMSLPTALGSNQDQATKKYIYYYPFVPNNRP